MAPGVSTSDMSAHLDHHPLGHLLQKSGQPERRHCCQLPRVDHGAGKHFVNGKKNPPQNIGLSFCSVYLAKKPYTSKTGVNSIKI